MFKEELLVSLGTNIIECTLEALKNNTIVKAERKIDTSYNQVIVTLSEDVKTEGMYDAPEEAARQPAGVVYKVNEL